MLIYEVKLEFIDKTIYSSFLVWLKEHISIMLSFEGFDKADLENNFKEKNTILIKYHVKSEKDLNNYIYNHSEKMRSEGLKLFKNSFKASRKIYPLKKLKE